MIRKIARTYHTSFSGLSRETWLFSIVMFVNRASTMVAPFLSMYITQSMHRSIGDAGLIITLFGIGSVTGSAAGGYFIDRLGFRTVQIFTSLVGGVFIISFGMIRQFFLLCIWTVLLSFFLESFRPANLTAVVTYSNPQNLTRSYSLNRLAVNLGWGFGSSLGGILAAINYHLLFWVEGLAYIMVSFLIVLLLPSNEKTRKTIHHEELDSSGKDSPWKDSFLLRFLFLATIFNSCFILMFRLAPVYWKEEFHLGESLIGIFLGLNGIIIALFEMVLIRYWESRRSIMYYIISGTLLIALGYIFLLVPGINPLWLVLLAVVFLTMGEMMALPFINTTIMRRATSKNKGRYASAYAMTWSVAMILGPGTASLIIDHWNYRTLWLIIILACNACALSFYALSQKTNSGLKPNERKG
jgi:predicted MFS family arabinose efflux permease